MSDHDKMLWLKAGAELAWACCSGAGLVSRDWLAESSRQPRCRVFGACASAPRTCRCRWDLPGTGPPGFCPPPQPASNSLVIMTCAKQRLVIYSSARYSEAAERWLSTYQQHNLGCSIQMSSIQCIVACSEATLESTCARASFENLVTCEAERGSLSWRVAASPPHCLQLLSRSWSQGFLWPCRAAVAQHRGAC